MGRTVSVKLEADSAGFVAGVEPAVRKTATFQDQLTKLDVAIRKLPDVKVSAETSDAEVKLAALKKEMESLRDERLGITIDSGLAMAQIARIRTELAALGSSSGSSQAVRFDASAAGAELDKLTKKLVPSAEKLVPEAEKVADKVGVSFVRRMATSVENGMQKVRSVISSGLTNAVEAAGNALATLPWPLILGVAAIAAAVGGPLVAAVTASIGLAGITGGIILAFHDPQIKAAASDLKDTLVSGLQDAAVPFVEPLMKGIGILKAGFQASLPVIKDMFTQLAPSVTNVATGISGFLTNLTKGFADAAVGAKPFIDMFASRLPEVGATIGNVFKELNFDSTASRENLAMFFNILNGGIKVLGVLAQGLERVGQGVNMFVKGASYLATFGQKIVDPAAGSSVEFLGKSLRNLQDSVAGLNPALALTASQITALITQFTTLTPTVDTLAGKMTDAVMNSMLNADKATLGFDKSLVTLGDTLVANGGHLSAHVNALKKTETGAMQNKDAILAVVQANLQVYDSMIASGISADDATAAYESNTRALEDQLRAAGWTSGAIQGVIGKYRNVPRNVNTVMAIQGLTDAINGLSDLIRLINGIHSKTVTVTVNTVQNLQSTYSQQVPRFAGGGTLIPAASGLAYGAGIYPASNPPLIKFAEPQTRGETLIPNYGIPAARGLALADYAASHYGGRVTTGGPSTVNLHATFVTPSGEVWHRQVIRYALDTNRSPADLFPASTR